MSQGSVHNYGPHELQSIKILKRAYHTKDTILFIHGGGWRDPANTFDDFAPLVKDFNDLDINLVSINYRLSPKVNSQEELANANQFQHPRHLIDVVYALKYIIETLELKITVMVGHSVGSSLILQLLNYDKMIKLGYSSHVAQGDLPNDQEIKSFDQFMTKIELKSIFLLDGIFNVLQLLDEYPDYDFFVNSAFHDVNHQRNGFQLSNGIKPDKLLNHYTMIYIVYSLQDELLSINQSNLMNEFLQQHGIKHKMVTGNWGKHEELYTRSEISKLIIDSL